MLKYHSPPRSPSRRAVHFLIVVTPHSGWVQDPQPSALVAIAGSAEGAGPLYASSIIVTIASVIEIIAGAKGLKACKNPELAGKCITWGILIVVVSIISMVIGLIGGGKFSIANLALNLLVPGLYIYGAMQMKTPA